MGVTCSRKNHVVLQDKSQLLSAPRTQNNDAEINRMQDELRSKIEENMLLKKQIDASLLLQSENRPASGESVGSLRSVSKPLHEQVDLGFKWRDVWFVQIVFGKHHDRKNGSLSKSSLHSVLTELGLDIDQQRANELFDEFDSDNSDGLSLHELHQLLQKASKLHEWAKGLPLHALLADAIPRKPGVDPLRVVSGLTDSERLAVCEVVRNGLERMLKESSELLQKAFCVSDKRKEAIDGSKFNIVPVSCGNVNDFHNGVEGRIGAPSLKFEPAMESEHCNRKDSLKEFKTGNYNITTWPMREWLFAVNRLLEGVDMGHERVVRDVDQLLEEHNKLVSSEDAKLKRPEVIAVVLYTGPMFQVYNVVLRQFPRDAYNVQLECSNVYTTTIYVLVSAVTNIARETRLSAGLKLYRGLGGDKTFPVSFFKSNDKGHKGVLEWAFMSTTANKSIALQYSGIRQGKPHPTILEMDAGSVDRGADLSSFSQYPGEKEFLFQPHSFLEPLGGEAIEVTADGVVGKVHVRVNANLKARSLTELEEAKKTMHVAAFRYLMGELDKELGELAAGEEAQERKKADTCLGCFGGTDFEGKLISRGGTVEALCEGIMEDCRAILTKHEGLPAADFLDDGVYRYLVAEALETKDMGKIKFLLWLHGTEEAGSINAFKHLKACHREWNLMQQRRLAELKGGEGRAAAALGLCRSTGLVRREIEERNNFGETPLMRAAADGESEAVLRLLVDARADVGAKRGDEATVLHLAAAFDRAAAIETLVGLGADKEAVDSEGFMPLHVAALSGQVSAIEALARLGASVNVTTECHWVGTPLHLAASLHRVGAIEALVALGASLEAEDAYGSTPLVSAQKGSGDAARKQEAVAALERLCGAPTDGTRE